MYFEPFDKSTFEDFLREANTKPDYTTNAGSYYKDLARKNHLIELLSKRIWDYDIELAKRFEEWAKNLEAFPDDVEILLREWINDGTIEKLINEELFETLNTQLQTHELKINDSAISPDDFTGTDYEKVQKAIDEAVLNKKGIKLTRVYDVTNDIPLKINKSGARWTLQFMGSGGGFKKSNGGFMFDTDNEFVADLNFNSVRFEGVPETNMTVFNGDKMWIINTNMCVFFGVDKKITALNYIQSIRSKNDRVTNGSGFFVETPAAYDYVEDGILVEVRESFFKQTIEPVGSPWNQLYGTRFVNGVIEGLTGIAIQARKTETLVISGMYVEKNEGGNIVFDDDSVLSGVIIENTQAHESMGALVRRPLIKWGGQLVTVKSENNRTNNASVHDTSSVTDGYVLSYRDVSGYNFTADVDPDKRILKRDNDAWYRMEDTTRVVSSDNVIKLSKDLENQTLLPLESKTFNLNFSRDIYLDDSISLQLYTIAKTSIPNRIVRDPLNKKIVSVTLTNASESDTVNVSLYVTILKFDRIKTQKG